MSIKKTVLITGASGFVGKYLIDILKNEYELVLTTKSILIPGFQCLKLDMTDNTLVQSMIDFEVIDYIINLAAFSSNKMSLIFQTENKVDNNVKIVSNIIQGIISRNKSIRLLNISSGSVYDPSQQMPISENGRLINAENSSPYTRSKIRCEEIISDYCARFGIKVITVRPFNHIGPGQKSGFLIPDIVNQLIQDPTTILVGNLDSKRDYTDVRDVVVAYKILLTSDNWKSQVYNVCSGKSISGRKLLELICIKMQIKYPNIKVAKNLIRTNETIDIFGDNSKIRNKFNWSPKIDIENTINDIVISTKK